MIQTENKDFARDITTKALVNTNHQALAEHKYRLNLSKQIDSMRADISFLMTKLEDLASVIEDMRKTHD